MALELNELKTRLKQPEHKHTIKKAESFEKRLQFHTETNIDFSDMSSQATSFLEWVRTLIPSDKYNVFTRLFKLPIPTISLVEDVYRELERVFYSRNSNAEFQFTAAEFEEDWQRYRKEVLGEPDIWRDEGYEKMKTAINSVLIVDLPAVQTTERPEPYFYWLDINNVIDFETRDGIELEWIIFKTGNENEIAVFDDESYRVFKVNDKWEIVSVVTNNKHDIGYCPARFFWSSFITEKQRILKKNPITKELANIDWLLFYLVSKRHLDLYASYPIYSAYEAECDFTNPNDGSYCDGGFIRESEGDYIISNGGLLSPCPVCSEKRLAGPGSFLEIPTPDTQEGVPDMRSPVQITTIDRDSLDYNVSEVERLQDEIIVSCVGSGGTVSEKEAINETQVAANFEDKTSVLNNLKKNFENAQKFVDDTCCIIRYGEDFVDSSISWGTEFYVFTVDNLYSKYNKAKENGASISELDAITEHILEVEYKNSPLKLQRMLILKQVEPFRHRTLEEVLTLAEKNIATEDDVRLKVNLMEYIERFERENMNIVEFGSNLEFNRKIEILINTLKGYGKEQN